jgi:hypothetical protein
VSEWVGVGERSVRCERKCDPGKLATAVKSDSEATPVWQWPTLDCRRM